ncbi:hypothetical protein D3C73_1467980 [compost metagenome]
MADPVRHLPTLLADERGNRRQIVTGIVGHPILAVLLIALRQAVAAHFRDPHIKTGARQIGAQPKALG